MGHTLLCCLNTGWKLGFEIIFQFPQLREQNFLYKLPLLEYCETQGVCVFSYFFLQNSFFYRTHQQHEVIEPFASLLELHRANPGSLEGLVVGRQRDVQRVRVGQQEGNTHPLYTQTNRRG